MEENSSTKIMARVLKRMEGKDLLEALINLNNPDFQSLMLEVFRGRAARQTPAQLLQSYQQNAFVHPAALPYTASLKLDTRLIKCLPKEFELLELSPLSPLGSCSSMATVNQNKIVSALRNSEVVADATNVMALESALRRHQALQNDPHSNQEIHLASSHRHVRNQSLMDEKHSPHFRIFALCSAGRDQGHHHFETHNLARHLDFYSSFLKPLCEAHAYQMAVRITFWESGSEKTAAWVMSELQRLLPEITLQTYPQRASGQTYYPQGCFHIDLIKDGQEMNLVDGGFTTWTQDLLNNKKERLLISGMGSELLMKLLPL